MIRTCVRVMRNEPISFLARAVQAVHCRVVQPFKSSLLFIVIFIPRVYKSFRRPPHYTVPYILIHA